jgi:hypothetical protein
MLNKDKAKPYFKFQNGYLGSIEFLDQKFPLEMYREVFSDHLKKCTIFEQHERIGKALFTYILRIKEEVFLLPKLVSFLIEARAYLPSYHLSSFEFWMNHYTGATEEEKSTVRSRIVGKKIPRSEYQRFFPIGGGVEYTGSHYVFAHYSPDLDTTVASFATFLAAFGAKVGKARHHWVIPGGPPRGSKEMDFIFRKGFGEGVFSVLSSDSHKVPISSLDLLSHQNVVKKKLKDPYFDFSIERGKKAVVLVDDEGCYIGDWRDADGEFVDAIVNRFFSIFMEHSNGLQNGLISLFAKKPLTRKALENFIESIFARKLSDCNSTKECNNLLRIRLDKFIREVLGIKNGYCATFGEFLLQTSKQYGFSAFAEGLQQLTSKVLFGKNQEIIEDRELIFKELEKLSILSKRAIDAFVHHLDSLEIAFSIKTRVIELQPHQLSHLAEIDEITKEMGEYTHLTVNYKENGKYYPLGVVYAADIHKKKVATTSWNDFSNPDETDSRPDVEVISFIDHHKMEVKSNAPITGIVRDAQSTNSIIANLVMEINQKYSSGGMSEKEIDAQIQEILQKELHLPEMRVLERLLEKKKTFSINGDYYISLEREILEYYQFLYAILDDTDILTKVTEYDVYAVASLLNRMKSIMVKKEVEIVHFDDLSKEENDFPSKAAKRLLKTTDLFSIYSEVYKAKEDALNQIILDTAKGGDTPFFQDTKRLGGGYASVGQLKYFAKNAEILQKKIGDLRQIWVERCQKIHAETSDVNLHIFMLSTIASADELFADTPAVSFHRDQLWFWIPESDKKAIHLLKEFLEHFCKSSKILPQELEVEFCGKSLTYEKVFGELSREFVTKHLRSEHPMVALYVDQKSVTSRKSQVAAFLSNAKED